MCNRKLARLCWRIFTAAMLLLLVVCWPCLGSPFRQQFRYTQPDGTTICLWGQGDEFSAVFETLEGYTVVFALETRAYCYARVSADGTALESTGVLVGQEDPALLGLRAHQRIDARAARLGARAQYEAWDKSVGLGDRWSRLKSRALGSGPRLLSPSTSATTGVKCGLTVLIDFEDERATISREEVSNFLNGDNYTGFGNNGSVKQYFADVSNGRLTFTNTVTPYITIPKSVHPRSYYNDTTKNCFVQGNYLVHDALEVMKSLPNFTNDFLPLLEAVTVNSQKKVVSANFFVAGEDSGVWTQGIWGHCFVLSQFVGQQTLWSGGMIVDAYQLTPMGEQLELAVFCHENGHLFCGFPDLYDYDSDSWGGAGCMCLMSWFPSPINPPQVCAYLKAAAGWASVVDLPSGTNFVASLSAGGPGFNQFYRIRKPGVSTEYFLLENRQRTGRDAEISGSGIAVWHIDELGDRDNQGLQTNSNHLNYAVTLEQADNRWDLEFNGEARDSEDLFYAGNLAAHYANAFSDLTSPSAQWWDGLRSGLVLSDFSANGQTMTFTAKVDPVVVRFDPVDLTVFETQPAAFTFSLASVSGPSIQWYKDGAPLTALAGITGVDTNQLTIAAAAASDAGSYWAVITHAAGTATTRVAQLTVKAGTPLLSASFGRSGTTILMPDGADLTSTGKGIGGTSDSFHFAYHKLSGDFDVRVRLRGINMESSQTRAGLMIRELATANSPHFSLLSGLTPDGEPYSLLTRLTSGGPTQERFGFLAPCEPYAFPPSYASWQRIRREGNRYTCYLSENGSDWTWLQSLELELGTEVCVGLALAAGPAAPKSAYAWFRDYAVLTNAPSSLAIFAPDPIAREGTLDSAQVAVHCSRNGPLQAAVRLGGTAVGGLDYLPLASTVTIPAGTNVGLLVIRPMNDALPSGPKTIEVSLVEQPDLELVQPAKATALILDDEQIAGGLTRQVYRGIGGATVASLAQQMTNLTALTEVACVSSFEAPTNSLNYGQILAGYLVPPETGDYVFYLASDENSELWLSTDADPANARRIAAIVGKTLFRHYLGSGNHSEPIPLEQGNYYYVKALHKKQGWDPDCFSLAWKTPGGSAPTNGSAPIDGVFLAFSAPSADGLSLTPQAASLPGVSGSGMLAVTAHGEWTAESLDPWIVLTGSTNGTGNAQVTYQVAANPTGVQRVGTIVINGHIHSVIQAVPFALRIGLDAGQALALTFETSTAVVLQASGDLEHWQPIWTNTVPATLPLTQIDPAASSQSVRFYRAVMK